MKIAAALAFTIVLSGVAYAADPVIPPSVPSGLEPPAGSKPILVGHAIGTQNYICAPGTTPGTVEWFFLGPQATVFNDDFQEIVTHFLSKNPYRDNALQATWLHSRDASAVWAVKLRGSTDSNYVSPGAIEWLLLEIKGAQAGPTGGDKLSTAKYIQRVNTEGGVKPPASDCTWETVNTRKFVDYTADYYFWE